jgi:cytochrome c-type biogenesis protein CcmF
VGRFEVRRDGEFVTYLEPAKRRYDMPPQPTTEAGIDASWRGDLYVVLGDEQDLAAGTFAVRIYFHPLVRLIWGGALIMFLGGALSLADRRLRIGAPVRATKRVQPAE